MQGEVTVPHDCAIRKKKKKERQVYADRRGSWQALDRPMASRPIKGVYCAHSLLPCMHQYVPWQLLGSRTRVSFHANVSTR